MAKWSKTTDGSESRRQNNFNYFDMIQDQERTENRYKSEQTTLLIIALIICILIVFINV